MDGYDLSVIDQLDQDAFNGSPDISDEEQNDMPLPDCIGLDSAYQDDEMVRLEAQNDKQPKVKSRSERERELELKSLRPDSIRRQIFEQSLKSGNNKVEDSSRKSPLPESDPPVGQSHVMNIVEKAGMRGIDKEKINEIIHKASKGSLFYKRQAQRQEEIHKSIEKMLNKVRMATPLQVANAKVTCDKLIECLKKQQAFNRIIVHFDLDMFFAAVEIRDNPELADKPVAVGGDSMVSTSNYIARKYGVRAAMPGFIAKKLCPELILIKPNGSKYRQSSSEVFSVLEQYDPDLAGMSLDEAYLDLTDYVKSTLERDGFEIDEYYDGTLPKVWWSRASEIVQQIREAIFQKTKLTCSAGIACNTLLSKISTDINKPNGQFMVEGYPREVVDFIQKTPVGKVSGIGKVSAQFLNALEIKTCGDIYEKRYYLPLVFYEINVRFYLRVSLGDGSTSIKSDEQRKSKSVERTFTAVKDPLILLDKLDSICEELCTKYLKPYRIRGRTVTIKLKRNTFTTTTRGYTFLVPTNDKLVIYSSAKNLLMAEIADEPPEISYRLLGVRLSNLLDDSVTMNQLTIDALLRNPELNKSTKSQISVHQVDSGNSDFHEHPQDLEPEVPSSSGKSTCSEATTIDDIQAENDRRGIKRKRLETKRIEDFFYSELTEGNSHIDSTRTQFIAQDNENVEDPPKPPLKKRLPDEDDFPCPYCLKTFETFDTLESHVGNCNLKTSIDIHKLYFNKRCNKDSQPITPNSQSDNKRKLKLSQSEKKLFQTPTVSRSTKSVRQESSRQSPCLSQKETVAKVSFYEKFIESNSVSLSKSPKFEPFQCPYCTHGFVSFASLENHVSICNKRN